MFCIDTFSVKINMWTKKKMFLWLTDQIFSLLLKHFPSWCTHLRSLGRGQRPFQSDVLPARSLLERWRHSQGCSMQLQSPDAFQSLSSSKPKARLWYKNNNWITSACFQMMLCRLWSVSKGKWNWKISNCVWQQVAEKSCSIKRKVETPLEKFGRKT